MTLDGMVEFVGGSLAVSVIIVGWYHFTTEWSVHECDVVISVILWKTSEFCLHINAGQFQYQRLPLIGCVSQFPVGGPRGCGNGANVSFSLVVLATIKYCYYVPLTINKNGSVLVM